MTGIAIAPRRTSEVWIWVVLIVFFGLMNVQYHFKITHSNRPNSQSAFQRWTPQVRELSEGKNIWALHNWPNPPIMALILKPYMEMESALVGSILWMLTKMALTGLSIYLVFTMLDRPEHPFPFWGKMLALILSLRPIEGDLIHGNVNLFILATVVVAVYAFTQGWDVMAGMSLALGIACKLTPALFLPYLVWKRAWKTLAATSVGLLLFFFLVPSLFLGWDRNLACLDGWVNGMVRPYLEKNEVTSEHQNQSLPGFLERMFRDRPAFTTHGGTEEYVPEPDGYYNIANLPRWILSLTAKFCLGLFCLAVMWRCRAPLGDRTDWRWVAEFGVVVMGMLIFSERTWKHHAVTLLIPFAVLCHQLFAFQLPTARWRYLVGTISAAAILMALTMTSRLEGHDTFGKIAEVYGAYLWTFVLLLSAMFTLAGQKERHPLKEMQAPISEDRKRAA